MAKVTEFGRQLLGEVVPPTCPGVSAAAVVVPVPAVHAGIPTASLGPGSLPSVALKEEKSTCRVGTEAHAAWGGAPEQADVGSPC